MYHTSASLLFVVPRVMSWCPLWRYGIYPTMGPFQLPCSNDGRTVGCEDARSDLASGGSSVCQELRNNIDEPVSILFTQTYHSHHFHHCYCCTHCHGHIAFCIILYYQREDHTNLLLARRTTPDAASRRRMLAAKAQACRFRVHNRGPCHPHVYIS